LHARLDRLFADLLVLVLDNLEKTSPGDRSELLTQQPIVMARLAGFLAAHTLTRDDGAVRAVEALLVGYREADDE